MPSRWEKLLEQKPVPIVEHLLEELSKLFAQDLSQWPPPLEDLDPATGQTFAALVAPDAPKPTKVHFEEAFRLTRWELQREFEAIDDYVRNQRWRARELPAADKPLLLFLSRWMVEQLLSLGEATGGRINRARMIDCLERTERRLLASPLT